MNDVRTCLDDPNPLVLVIDDSADVHRLLNVRLKQEEIELRSALSGREGLELAERLSPAIILLDLDMPDLDGFEVLRRLKNNPATMHIPVIVLSGLQSAPDKVAAFDLGAVDYVTKPFNLTELRVRVRSAVRMHRLVEMLARRAHIDGLTGLWNRAHFDRRIAEEVSGCARHGRALSLALLDADNFKSINDTYGHPAGDVVLRGLARILAAECRQGDVACRYGGEEFALIMPDTPPSRGLVLCERIRASVASTLWPRHPERRVTVSIGMVGTAVVRSAAVNEWLEQVDRALYAAKTAGRNRVVMVDLNGGATLARAG